LEEQSCTQRYVSISTNIPCSTIRLPQVRFGRRWGRTMMYRPIWCLRWALWTVWINLVPKCIHPSTLDFEAQVELLATLIATGPMPIVFVTWLSGSWCIKEPVCCIANASLVHGAGSCRREFACCTSINHCFVCAITVFFWCSALRLRRGTLLQKQRRPPITKV